MITKLATPGVYVNEVPTLPPSVAEVDSAVPAFVGYTEKATLFTSDDLHLIPHKISSLEEFETHYGFTKEVADSELNDAAKGIKLRINEITVGGVAAADTIKFEVVVEEFNDDDFPKYNLYHSLKHYFANGGGNCFIVSAGKFEADNSIHGTKLEAGVKKLSDLDEPTILAIPEAALSDNYKLIYEAALKQAEELKDRFVLIDPKQVTIPRTQSTIDADAVATRADITASSYAAVYYPNLITVYDRFDIDKVIIDTHVLNGAVLPIPAPSNHNNMAGKTIGEIKAMVGRGIGVYSLLKRELSKYGKTKIVLPPSPAMAGIYCRVDSKRGYWKAPANEAVKNIVGPVIDISNKQQENLNLDSTSGESINVIRTFPGYGTLVWGSRTMLGNDNEWRYVNVRRLFMVVEESIKKSLQWVVFEPNTASTWVRVQGLIENYLYLKWRDGALAGVKPEDAYYVEVGLNKTMTPQDILEGKMYVKIGLAVSRPAEFVVLNFYHLLQVS
ncbi:MAG: phage tail sheath family protein [Leadbetterella sp.]